MTSAFLREPIDIDELSLLFNALVWEVIGSLHQEGLSFFPARRAPDKLSMKCDWELGNFANAVTYLGVMASQELQPYSAKIGSKFLNRHIDSLANLSHESLMTLDVRDNRTLILQFRRRVDAYATAFAQSDGSGRLFICDLFSLVIFKLRETGSLGTVDDFLGQYIQWPAETFESLPLLLKAELRMNNLISNLAYTRLLTAINTAFIKIPEKHNIADSEPAAESERIIQCPKCGRKLRIPSVSHALKVECPECKESFVWG